MASIEASNNTIKPYFSDNTTNKVHTYLFYSNYEYNKTTYNSESYNVNLFCLVQIAKLLYDEIQKNTHNNIGFRGSVKRFNKSFSKLFSNKSNKTKKQNNNNNKKQSLITKLNDILFFIINKLPTKQNFKNFNENKKYNVIVNGILKNLEIYIKNPIFFNQNLFGNKNINLNFIEKDIDIDEQVLEIDKITDLLEKQLNISEDFEEIKDIDLILQYTKFEKENNDRKKNAQAKKNKQNNNEEYLRTMKRLQNKANANFMSKMSNRLKRLKKK